MTYGQWSVLLACFLLFPGVFFMSSSTPRLRLIACDVGQGDAFIVRYGQSTVVIDNGRKSAIVRCLSRELSWWDPTIDVFVVTHPDADHIGGSSEMAKHFRIRSWWYHPKSNDPAAEVSLAALTARAGSPRLPLTGDSLVAPGFRARVVWEPRLRQIWEPGENGQDDTNSGSVGVMIEAKSFGFLSLGDLACAQELAVMKMPLLIPTLILKASHHGAKSSFCPEFLQNIHPEVLLVSSGAGNSYGHPDPLYVDYAWKNAIKLYRTDLMGDICLEWRDGQSLIRRLEEKIVSQGTSGGG